MLAAIFTQVGWIAYLVLWAVLPMEAGGPTGLDEAKSAFGKGTGSEDRPQQNPDDLR